MWFTLPESFSDSSTVWIKRMNLDTNAALYELPGGVQTGESYVIHSGNFESNELAHTNDANSGMVYARSMVIPEGVSYETQTGGWPVVKECHVGPTTVELADSKVRLVKKNC